MTLQRLPLISDPVDECIGQPGASGSGRGSGVNVNINFVSPSSGQEAALCNRLKGLIEFDQYLQSGGTFLWSSSLDYIENCEVYGSDDRKYVALRPSGPGVTGTGAKDSENPRPTRESTGPKRARPGRRSIPMPRSQMIRILATRIQDRTPTGRTHLKGWNS